uniref:VHS domain-containing protein n=1 Tax=Astyanax mexicanus TaxID=7994 RepID=A0A3B1KH28_ASTMX
MCVCVCVCVYNVCVCGVYNVCVCVCVYNVCVVGEVTDPNNVCERWNSIQEFYQHVNTQENGPQVALRLLVYKIQSPQEREALQALTLLEACMNNCGKRFHSEATKFRFLNELIKVLSPKVKIHSAP